MAPPRALTNSTPPAIVDARDRLRRYLEQRRELGESEFVLDGLPVEDVLKLVGMRQGGSTRSRASTGTTSRGRETGAPPDGFDEPPPSHTEAAPKAVPPMAPAPPVPERRFDDQVSTDWRATLRNAGALRPGATPAVPPVPTANTDGSRKPPVAAAEAADAPRIPAASVQVTLPPWLDALGIPAGLEAGRLHVAEFSPHVASLPTLQDVVQHVAACTACGLHKGARHAVPGEGNPQAEFLCVGEAPGANEDEQGRPFVGEAGQLLTKILSAIQLSRDDVYICNVLKHRPPGNRDPLPDEVQACQPYLLRQIELVRPKVILALGRFAAQTLLQTTTGIGALRGKVHRFQGVPLIVTYHPAALLRNESWKRPTWEDVKLARRILDAARATSSGAE